MSTIVVSGAAGFLGRRVVEALSARGDKVVAIARRPRPADLAANLPGDVDWVVADLLEPAAYEAALKNADAALHLAAITGKARPKDYVRGNVDATEAFVAACERAGVKRLVFVSSIAVSFSDRRFYPYADSKAAAEGLVRASSLPWTIVRPTMILGRGSPIQTSLETLAKLPAVPMFGDGRRLVQPVEVGDVAALLVALAHDADSAGAVIEVGGPEAFSMKELFTRLRGGEASFVHLPLGPLRLLLAAMEPALLPVMPLTAGQLASFANDGAAKPSAILDRLSPSRAPSPARAGA